MKGRATALLLAGLIGSPALAQGKAAGLKGNPGQFFGPDDYPAEALQAGEQGRVIAKLWVDAAGKVVSCSVTGSSGSVSLDRTTCDIAVEKVSFTPATDRRGRPIAATYTLPVRWVLPSGPTEMTAARLAGEIELTVSVDDTGEVIACNSRATPPAPRQFDPCGEFPVGKPSSLLWMRDGKPVGGTMVRTFRQRITLDP